MRLGPCGLCAVSISQLDMLVTADSVRSPRHFPPGRRSPGSSGRSRLVSSGGEDAASAEVQQEACLWSRLPERKPHVGPITYWPRAELEVQEARLPYCVDVTFLPRYQVPPHTQTPLEVEAEVHPGVNADGKAEGDMAPWPQEPPEFGPNTRQWLWSPLLVGESDPDFQGALRSFPQTLRTTADRELVSKTHCKLLRSQVLLP